MELTLLATSASIALIHTVLVMLFVTTLAMKGLSFVKLSSLERYSPVPASFTIISCGVLMLVGF